MNLGFFLLAALYNQIACASDFHGSNFGHGDLTYHGPTAIPHVLHDGHIADTPEVAVAKAQHFVAVSTAKSHGGYGYGDAYGYGAGYEYGGDYGYGRQTSGSHGGDGYFRYYGPTAIPKVLHNGHIADTHEVAAAKAHHLIAVASAKAQAGYGYGGYSGQYAGGYSGVYHGPLAQPVVLPSGYLADTREVAAARQHHLQALHSSHQGHYDYQY